MAAHKQSIATRNEFKKIQLLAAVIITVFLAPLILLVTLPFLVIRQIVIQIAKHTRPDLGSILVPQSGIVASDLFTGNPLRTNVISTSFFVSRLDPVDFRDNMVLKNWINARDPKTGELVYERFQQYPTRFLGYTFWKQELFDIDNHLFFHENLGNRIVSTEELKRFEEKLLNTSYKANTSTWELHIVYNYHNPKLSSELMCVPILKIHHSLADGYSILGALIEGLFQQPLDDQLLKPVFPKKDFWEQFVYYATAPFVIVREVSNSIINNWRDSPWKVRDNEKSWNIMFSSSDPIPIGKVKDVKNTFGVSFTSVLVSCISAAICDNFSVKRKEKVIKGDDGSIYGLCVLPLPGHTRNLTNQATGAMIDIPTIEFSSCEKRLQHCHSVLEAGKSSIFPMVMVYFVSLAGAYFSQVGAFLAKSHALSTGITNFPNLGVKLKRGQCEIVSSRFAVGSLDGDAGVAFMVLSHNDHITLTITAEQAVMTRKELEILITCFAQEIDLLHKMAA